jgi:signal transduction histidine kinase
VELSIHDDGRGGGSGVGLGHGLIGMRERVALYGGQLTAGRRPGGGFGVHVLLPVR